MTFFTLTTLGLKNCWFGTIIYSIHLYFPGTHSFNSLVFSRYLFIQFTCIFQVLIHSIHLYFPGTYSFNSPVFSRYSFIQFTCIFQVLIHSIHLYFPGPHSFNSPVFSRYSFNQLTCIFQILIHSTHKNRLKPKLEIWRMKTRDPDYFYCLFLLIERPKGKVGICLLNMSIVRREKRYI